MENEEINLSGTMFKLPPQANLQLPDPELLNYYNDTNNRIVYLEGEIDGTAVEIIKYIMRRNIEDFATPVAQRKPIIIAIDSIGGSVEVMQTIIGAINASKTPIATVNICTAYSAAGYILACGDPGLRFALPNTACMFHSGFSSFSGTTMQVDNAKKFFDGVDKRITDLVFARTKIPSKVQKKIKSAEDVYMTELEALEYGVIDHVASTFDDIFTELQKIGGETANGQE